MTKKQKTNKLSMGLFKKYVTCIMAFFTPFNSVIFCQFYFNAFPVSFIKPE